MRIAATLILAASLCGCVQVMEPQEVNRAIKKCQASGGVSVPTTVNQYQSAVKWIDCYGRDGSVLRYGPANT